MSFFATFWGHECPPEGSDCIQVPRNYYNAVEYTNSCSDHRLEYYTVLLWYMFFCLYLWCHCVVYSSVSSKMSRGTGELLVKVTTVTVALLLSPRACLRSRLQQYPLRESSFRTLAGDITPDKTRRTTSGSPNVTTNTTSGITNNRSTNKSSHRRSTSTHARTKDSAPPSNRRRVPDRAVVGAEGLPPTLPTGANDPPPPALFPPDNPPFCCCAFQQYPQYMYCTVVVCVYCTATVYDLQYDFAGARNSRRKGCSNLYSNHVCVLVCLRYFGESCTSVPGV